MNIETGISMYLAGIRGEVKATTLLNNVKTLNTFGIAFAGRELNDITADEITAWRNRLHVKPSSANKYLQRVRGLYKWLRLRGHTPSIAPDLVRPLKTGPVTRVRFDPKLLPVIVQGARHPRDAAFLATAIELLLRAGELANLRVRDVLPTGHLRVMVEKQDGTFDEDEMAIGHDLQQLLAAWLADYRREAGIVPRDAYLFPRITVRRGGLDYGYRLEPSRPIAHPEEVIKLALARAGADIAAGTGVHAVRRTCARLLFDYLVEHDGADRALGHVSSLMHHTSRRTTEVYLGVQGDRVLRNKLVRNGGPTPLSLSNYAELDGSVLEGLNVSPLHSDGV